MSDRNPQTASGREWLMTPAGQVVTGMREAILAIEAEAAALAPPAVPTLVSTIKARRLGFGDCIDSEECIVQHLAGRMSVVLLLPALALSAVTGISVTTNVLLMGVITTIYTVLGGMKAVIWTDVAQFFVLFGSVGAMVVLSVLRSGGVAAAAALFRINRDAIEERRHSPSLTEFPD